MSKLGQPICEVFVKKFNTAQDSLCSFLLKVASDENLRIKMDNKFGAIRLSGVTFKVSSDFLDTGCKSRRIVVTVLRSDKDGFLRFSKVWANEIGEFNLNEVYEAFDCLRLKDEPVL